MINSMTDSMFKIGKQHDICEDYAIEGKNIITVCDGCSSAPMTDFGARLIALKNNEINSNLDCECYFNKLKAYVESLQRITNLSPDCFNATLLTSLYTNDEFITTVIGDGFVVVKYYNHFKIIKITFNGNAPFYIRYAFEDFNIETYFSNHGNYEIQTFTTTNLIDIEEVSKEHGKLNSKLPVFQFTFNSDDIEYVALLSDGIDSFIEQQNTGTSIVQNKVEIFPILKELLNFKRFNANFVKRRMNKAFKTFERNNWVNFDDVSLAVIHKG